MTLTVRVELPEVITDWTTETAAEVEEGAAVVEFPLDDAEAEAEVEAETEEALLAVVEGRSAA